MNPYQLLPPLSKAEYSALKANIAAVGVLHPVVEDEAGNIIDGHHRKRAADELGMPYPRTVLAGLSEEQKVEQALTLNLGRRHLTADEKRTLVTELRSRGFSFRWINQSTGIPRSTVARYASRVPNGTPEYVGGLDGKVYRARRVGDPLDDWVAEVTRLVGSVPPRSPADLLAWIDRWFVEMFTQSEDELPANPLAQVLETAPKPTSDDLETGYWHVIAGLAAPILARTGKYLPDHPGLGDVENEKIRRITDASVGSFLDWAERHHLASSWEPDPAVFTSCRCDDCEQGRAAGIEDLAGAARGRVSAMLGKQATYDG